MTTTIERCLCRNCRTRTDQEITLGRNERDKSGETFRRRTRVCLKCRKTVKEQLYGSLLSHYYRKGV